MRKAIYIPVFAALSLLLSGCRTRTVLVPVTAHDSITVLKEVHDSVYERDSVYVTEYRNGDTVFVYKTNTAYRYRNRYKTDTVYTSHIEMTPVYVNEERQVPAPLTFWQKVRLGLADSLLALMAAAAIMFFIRWRR